MLSPVALFIYKRPTHTAHTLEHLMQNPDFAASEIHVFCDGAKRAQDIDLVTQARNVVRSYNLPNVVMHEHEDNLGLAKSVIRGVTELCEAYGRVIVVEDDLLVSRGFLRYMNQALEKYVSYNQVMQICGHVYPFSKPPSKADAFFLPITNTYGWATWQRAWQELDLQCQGHEALRTDRSLRRRFNLDGTYPYSRMMFAALAGKMDVWAIKWWWTVFQRNGLCLYPQQSLVYNAGFNLNATNTQTIDTYINDPVWTPDRTALRLPDQVEADEYNFELLKRYIAQHYSAWPKRIKRQLSKIVNRMTRAYSSLRKGY